MLFSLFFAGSVTTALDSSQSNINKSQFELNKTKMLTSFNNDTMGWEQVVDGGFGNRNNVFTWSMKAYHDYIYVGTRNIADGCEIYRSSSGDSGTWEKIIETGLDPNNRSEGARNMIIFHDLLWVVTDCFDYGTQVWVTDGEDDDSDGIINWKKANLNGFGEGDAVQSSRSVHIYKGKLYVGARSDLSPRIYRYDGPTDFENLSPENWTLVNQELIDSENHNPKIILPGMMVNFTASDGINYLYVGIYQEPVPLFEEIFLNFSLRAIWDFVTYPLWKSELWRYDGASWEEVTSDGFGKRNVAAISAYILNNTLYFGTSSILGGEIWKTEDGENWTQIVNRGFGRILTQWSWRMHVYENRLIVGTFNPLIGCQIWASTNDHPESQDDFIQINVNGMDETGLSFPIFLKQDGVRTFETFKGHLYAGTACFMDFLRPIKGPGVEVWRLEHLPE